VARDTPVVGLTGYHDDVLEEWGGPYRALICETDYTDAFLNHGALPVIVPAHPSHAAAIISSVDALLLTGGSDVDPRRYRHATDPRTYHPDSRRDEFELALIEAAIGAGRPILGICRGLQILNVALGGTLTQHVEDHARRDMPGGPAQSIEITPGSRLHAALGVDTLEVNSLHHQAVASLGAGLIASARAADGVVEALEHQHAPILAVQWHPEKLTDKFSYKALITWLLDSIPAEPVA
jgi:putative glutamine amidotransferase